VSDRLDGRVAVVTGSSAGIGRAIATAFAHEGATLVLADIRREPKLDGEQSVFDRLNDLDTRYTFVEADVSVEADIDRVVEAAEDTFGGLDILVNNAGIYPRRNVEETEPEEWDRVLAVNLRSIYLLTRRALPALRESVNPKILNLASIDALVGSAGSAAYSASKGGIVSLTRQLAVEYGPEEVNVNAIAPGIIKTTQNEGWRRDEQQVEQRLQELPWPHFGSPDAVADAAVFLASDESDYITGDTLRVDGGWTAR